MSKKLAPLALLPLLAACTSAEDVANEAALMYSAPFMAVSKPGGCESKLKVAQELYKLQEKDYAEVKSKVDGVKDDAEFKAQLKKQVEEVQGSAAARGFAAQCQAESVELAKIADKTAADLGISAQIESWTPDPGV